MSTVLHLRLLVGEDIPYDEADELGELIARALWGTMNLGTVRYLGGTAVPPPPTPRVSIHPHTYRDKAGFSVRSSGGGSIFVETRAAAEKIKARMLAGEDERMSDYYP